MEYVATKRCIEAGVESITSGVQSDHSCFIVGEDDYLQCYGGDNTHGQLGNGCFANRRDNRLNLNYVVAEGVGECYRDEFVPEDKRLKGVKQVVVGMTHTCALLKDGDLLCWGANDQGQLGRRGARSASPVSVVLPEGKTSLENTKVSIAHITAGDFHSCLLAKEGDERIFCWGQNLDGQAGKPFQVSIEDETPKWSYSDNTIVSEPDLITIAASKKPYNNNNNGDFECDSSGTINCHELDSGGFVPACNERQHFPSCRGGGVPTCTSARTDISIPCPTGGVIPDAELANQLNLRIEAEKITEDCSTMEAEDEEAADGEEENRNYNKLGFFGCKLGIHGDDNEIDFVITSNEDKFWEQTTFSGGDVNQNHEEREHDLPRIPPNFDCEEFYKVEHAKTDDETGNAYKNILCDLSSTTDVDANCEAKILTLQEECKVIKSKWARTLERLYIRLNFNLGDEDDFVETYKYVSAGADHTCTVNSEDEVLCFGDNSEDQLGQKKFANNDAATLCMKPAGIETSSKYPLRVRDSEKSDQNAKRDQ